MTTTKPETTEMTANADHTDGFQLTIDALTCNGVETIYGVIGIPVTDLARLAEASGIRYLGFRNEAAAGNAAAAAGFLTRRPGICLTVSAPGFLNGLTALANATVNCFPMIQISGSGNRAMADLGRGDYQELDQLEAARPFAKAAYRVGRIEDIGLGVARAIRTAVSGRPGGVYLDLPGEVLGQRMAAAAGAATIWRVADPAPAQAPSADAVHRAVGLLAEAKRPLIVLGKGAAYAQADDEVRKFVEQTGIPFLPMPMAKGLLPDDHRQSVAAARSSALGGADVVLLIGSRLNWMLDHGEPPRWAADARFIQVDIDAAEFDSNRPIAAPLAGDVGSVLRALSAALQTQPVRAPGEWAASLAARVADNRAAMERRLAEDPHPMRFYNALRPIRDLLRRHPEIYLVNEGANAMDITRNVVDMAVPRHRLDAGTWGVMGVGLGYAIAAAVETGQRVLAVEGDSAFGFSAMEVETICRNRLPITVVVLNNGGIYRGDERDGTTPGPTALSAGARHELIAEAFGAKGYHVTTPTELHTALTEALAIDGPAVIDCQLDPAAGVESGHLKGRNPTSDKLG